MILIATTDTGLDITVLFKHDTLFEKIQSESARRIKHIVQTAEEFDALQIMPSDRDWYNDNIQSVTDKLYVIASAYIKGNDVGYNPEVTITENTIDIGKHISYIMSIPDYDINLKNELEDQMYRYLKTGILSLWFKSINQPELYMVMEDEHQQHGKNIHSVLMQRINPIRRMMNHFP